MVTINKLFTIPAKCRQQPIQRIIRRDLAPMPPAHQGIDVNTRKCIAQRKSLLQAHVILVSALTQQIYLPRI
ncbi:hypothetical protein KDK_45890 [Dictyobacter kobayashii]|uniref:Uncharacterized protein n=1 Tax=Dictyobacter kobayashii TaxID=2014872 RepID=A0A402AP37_9CHLR|nr:hypothetical protein [Dictyobacter kobayashii]GCE20789.1 hypothetical protein KDK_45890 [Dictyobacter kobayashii]